MSIRSQPRSLARLVARSPWWGAAVGLLLGLGSLGSCLGELPRGRSCGDGWWDPEYEQCDRSSPDQSHVSACRALGFDVDAVCNDLCEIEASEADCTRCGDGIASGDEPCDGDDIRDAECPSGSGAVHCTASCELDFKSCPAVCGDGIVNGTEECDVSLSCGTDEDCGEGRVCHPPIGECVPTNGGFAPNLGCGFYETTAIGAGLDKPYASGEVSRCTDDCSFGRDRCGFCGDGELDGEYNDRVYPNGEYLELPAELCDGKEAIEAELEAYCEPLCVDDAINADVVVLCDFECNDDCSDFAPPDDIIPSPSAIGCCLAKDSPCPIYDTEGVPDLPCCGWLENPQWLETEKCVADQSGQFPLVQVCP